MCSGRAIIIQEGAREWGRGGADKEGRDRQRRGNEEGWKGKQDRKWSRRNTESRR